MSDPTDPPDQPPMAHREYDSQFDSEYDSRFDSEEAERRADDEARRRQRTILVIVLVATLSPFAVCGLAFAVCIAMMR